MLSNANYFFTIFLLLFISSYDLFQRKEPNNDRKLKKIRFFFYFTPSETCKHRPVTIDLCYSELRDIGGNVTEKKNTVVFIRSLIMD